MLSAEESAELRMLQARVYGSDGELSVGEVARLRELEQRQQQERERHGDVEMSRERSPDVQAPPNLEMPRDAMAPQSPALRRAHVRPWLAALAVVAVFALGIGAGWMLFGRPTDSSIGLTQEQRARGAELVADGDYDENSLRAMIVRDGVTVWLATTDAGGSLCLIVDDGSDATTACSDVDRVAADGLAAVHRGERDDHTDVAYATLLLTAEREPAVHLDVRRAGG